jgi:hypothetical protein
MISSLYDLVGNDKKQRRNRKLSDITYQDHLIPIQFSVSVIAPERCFVQILDVEINIADVNPIVRDWGIHPHVVRTQQLHVIVWNRS